MTRGNLAAIAALVLLAEAAHIANPHLHYVRAQPARLADVGAFVPAPQATGLDLSAVATGDAPAPESDRYRSAQPARFELLWGDEKR